MALLTSLLVLILVARILGQVFVRFNQPAIVGEMVAGVLLGPSVFNIVHANASLSGISELAVFLIVLQAGLEMDFNEIINGFKGKGLIIAGLGFIIPFLSGIAVGILFQQDVMRTVFLGLCIAITALPVAIRILQGFNLLNSKIAKYSVTTSILNDVTALLVLGVILNLPTETNFQQIGISVLYTGSKLALLAAFILGSNYFLQWIQKRVVNIQAIPENLVKMFGHDAPFGILIILVLTFGSISEVLGFHFVIGAFFASLLISRKFFLAARYTQIEQTLSSLTSGFLAPVFFAYLGLKFTFTEMHSVLFVVSVLVVSILSKYIAGYLGAKFIGLSGPESVGVGVILNGRGIMELVVASIALERGFIGAGLFSTLVLMGVVTTMITPIMFRRWVLPKLSGSQLDLNFKS
jgi:Kef-type K+ transport system membrane component KefB